MTEKRSSSFLSLSLLLLVGIFYLNFISRIALAPLLPIVEIDLGLGHGEAGSLFFYVAFGYATGLLTSGYITARIIHRRMITLSAGMLGLAMLALSLSPSIRRFTRGFSSSGSSPAFICPRELPL